MIQQGEYFDCTHSFLRKLLPTALITSQNGNLNPDKKLKDKSKKKKKRYSTEECQDAGQVGQTAKIFNISCPTSPLNVNGLLYRDRYVSIIHVLASVDFFINFQTNQHIFTKLSMHLMIFPLLNF
jgi:hypothetical protein